VADEQADHVDLRVDENMSVTFRLRA